MPRGKLAIIDEYGVLDPDAQIAEESLPSRLSAQAIKDAVDAQAGIQVPSLVQAQVPPLVATAVPPLVQAQVPPLVQAQVPPLVATAIAADSTVTTAAATAATNAAPAAVNAVIKGTALGTTDLNTLVVPRTWFQDYPGQLDVTVQHYPVKEVGVLVVTADDTGGGTVVVQRYTTKYGATYSRAKIGGAAWSKWASVTVTALSGDLDLYTTPGEYVCDWAGGATSAFHYPVPGTTGLLTVRNFNSIPDNSAIQEFRVIGTYAHVGKTWRREKHGTGAGTWTEWEIFTPNTEAATPGKGVLRDSAGRGKIVSPIAADDIANKAYVDTASGTAGVSAKRFDLYPGFIQLSDDYALLPAIPSKTTVDLNALAQVDRDKFFNVPSMQENWLGGPAPTNSLGSGQTWVFGLVTDSQYIALRGSHGLQNPHTLVLVDGVQTDQYSLVDFPAYTGHESGLYIRFDGKKRIRQVEILSRMKIWKYEVESSAQHAGFQRNTAKVAVVGDSWIDGTTQAWDTIGQQLIRRTPWRVGINAMGGSGFVAGGPQNANYIAPGRIDKVAAWAPDVTVLWGTINDDSALVADIQANARIAINNLLAAKANMKIILTGSQLASANQAARYTGLQTVAAEYPSNVKIYNAALKNKTGQTGPWDGAHPSPQGANQYADWLIDLIKIDVPA